MDAGLGDRDSLLLHCLVNCHLVLDIHLVELIDAADAVIGEHQCTSLYAKLARLRVLAYASSQTRCITRLAAAVDSPWHEDTDVLQELTFGCGWVANDADVDVTSELDLILRLFLDSAEQL